MRALLVVLALSLAAFPLERVTTIDANNGFDGRGRVFHKVRIEVRGDKIISVRELGNAQFPRADYDLRV